MKFLTLIKFPSLSFEVTKKKKFKSDECPRRRKRREGEEEKKKKSSEPKTESRSENEINKIKKRGKTPAAGWVELL